MNKLLCVALLLIFCTPVWSAGYSNWAAPSKVELVSGGVLVHGGFGDPNSCGEPNYIFISEQDSKYDAVLSMVLAAFMAQKEMQFYSSTCTQVGFHWSGNTINQNVGGQAVYVR